MNPKYFYKLLVIGLVAYFHLATAQNYSYYLQNYYPTYKNVFEFFSKNYDSRALPQGTLVKFAKKIDGWYVYQISPNQINASNPQPENMQLIWSLKDKKWKFIQMPLRRNLQDIPRFAESSYNKEYEIHFFYGYPDWHEDVINLLSNENRLTDKALESLARAYSAKASGLLFPHLDFQPTENAFDKRFQLKDMPEEDLVNALKSYEAAIETYQRLLKQNPAYHTPVGNIKLKLAHEYMTAYHDFMMIGDERRAKNFLQPNLYEDFFVSFAKNLLNTCEEKAILIVNGDTDTFAVLYAQAVLGIRQDVTLININLLNKARYINYLQNILPNSTQVKFAIALENYQNPATDIIYLADKDMGIKIGFEEIVQDLNKKMSIVTQILPLNQTTNALQIDAKQWHLPIKDDFKIKIKYFREYLYRENLALNDLIYSNLALRPVYFATTLDRMVSQPYFEYIYLEGFADKLSTTSSGRFDKVHWDKSYRNLKESMDWKGVDKSVVKDSAKINLMFNYRYRFSQIAGMLVENDQKLLALAIADQCYNLFPNDIIPYDFAMPYLAAVYYQLQQTNRGDKILEICMQNIELYLQTRYSLPPNFSQKVREDFYFFADFCDLTAEKFDRKDLQQKAKYLKNRVVGG